MVVAATKRKVWRRVALAVAEAAVAVAFNRTVAEAEVAEVTTVTNGEKQKT